MNSQSRPVDPLTGNYYLVTAELATNRPEPQDRSESNLETRFGLMSSFDFVTFSGPRIWAWCCQILVLSLFLITRALA